MRILGIDPGYALMGWGVIDADCGRMRLGNYGCVETKAGQPMQHRLRALQLGVRDLVNIYQPEDVAFEELFFARNVTTALMVGAARGAAIIAAAEYTENLYEYTPMQIKQAGVSLAFVPEDRLGMGLVGGMGMTGNMMLRSWRKGKGAFVNRKDPNELALKVKESLEVVTPSVEFPVRRLSGGNVQKVLVGREIASSPTVLMSAYAVRGLDINTSYTIYNLMTEQKKKGVAVLFVGEDLDVLLELCDRILVLCGGRVSGVVDARTATKEEVGLLMTRVGGGREEA